MIRYKVVNKNRGSWKVPFENRKYRKKYLKGEVVEMTPGSVGLMVYKNKSLANAEVLRNPNYGDRVLRVEPIDKALRPPRSLFMMWADTLSELYKTYKGKPEGQYNCWDIPKGTLFYRAVKVLD